MADRLQLELQNMKNKKNKYVCLYCKRTNNSNRKSQKFCNSNCSNNYQKENKIGYYNKEVQKKGGLNSIKKHKENKTFCYDKKIMTNIQKNLKCKKISSFYNPEQKHLASVAGGKAVQKILRKNKVSIFYNEKQKRNMMKHKVWNNKELQEKKGKKHSKFMRIYTQNKLISEGKIRLGKNETRILDEIELSINHKILRQYIVDGYFLDGYIPELNIVIEVDEDYHKNKLEKDAVREKNIRNKLNCNFIRIGDYLK